MATLTLPGKLRGLLPGGCLLTLSFALHAQTAAAHFSRAQSTVPIIQPANIGGGIAVDGAGNVYLPALNGYGVLKETLSAGVYTESIIPTSFLESAIGVAVDALGNVYVANNVPIGVFKETLFEGGYTESTIALDRLGDPEGIAVDGNGNLYLADITNQQILKATPSGSSYIQSTVPASGLGFPDAIAADAAGNVYVTDTVNHRILREAASGSKNTQSVVMDFASSERPLGVSVDARDNVYVLMQRGPGVDVLKETLSGDSYSQSTVVSNDPERPASIAADARGDIFLSELGNRVVKLQLASADFGEVNVASPSSNISLIFTFDTAGKVNLPVVVTQGALGLDFADAGTGSCTTNGNSHAYLAGDTCAIDVVFRPQFPGARYGAALLRDGFGHVLASAQVHGIGLGAQVSFLPGTGVSIDRGLVDPKGVAVDGNGSIYVAESGSGTMYKETLSDGMYLRTVLATGLSQPAGVAVDGRANVYIAASDGVYKETLSGGAYSQSKIVTDLHELAGIATDGSGNVYTTSSTSGDLHVATLQANGSYIESAIGSGIRAPAGVAIDGNGNAYISDARSGNVYEESLQANGSYIQTTIATGLTGGESIAAGGAGILYITSSTTGNVFKEALQADGTYIQTVAAEDLNAPWGIAVDGRGNLYLSQDTPRGNLAMIDFADPPSLSFVKTEVGSTSSDSPKTITVSNVGNIVLDFPASGSSTNPTIATNFSLSGMTTCPEVGFSGTAGSLGQGASCVYAINFVPVARGPISGRLVLTDSSLNAATPSYAKQSITLSGTGLTSDATRTTMRVSPNPVMVGLGVTITASVLDTTTPTTIPNGEVTFTDSLNGMMVSLNGGVGVPLSNGKAILNMISTTAGTHTITAHYGGVDDGFISSTATATLAVLP